MAFAIAFILVYFIMDLVIDIKNKNDDLMVDTLTRTDQTIIINKLMDYAVLEEENFDCDSLVNEWIDENSIKYNEDVIGIMNEYAVIDSENVYCSTNQGKVSIRIPVDVKQVDEDYDIVIDYKYDIGDMVAPWCEMTVNGSNVSIHYSDIVEEVTGSGVVGYYFGTDNPDEVDVIYTDIDGVTDGGNEEQNLSDGLYYFSVKDRANNVGSCNVMVDTTAPSCFISVANSTITGSGSDSGSGIEYAGFDSSYSGTSGTTKSLTTGTTTYYVKDKSGNKKSCSLTIASVVQTGKSCTGGTGYGCTYCQRTSTANCQSCTYNGSGLYTCKNCDPYCISYTYYYGCPSGYSAISGNGSYCYK